MNKYIAVLTIIIPLLFTSCSSNDEENIFVTKKDIEDVKNNFKSKEFKLMDTNNNIIQINTLQNGIEFKNFPNKVILLNVFAPWCPPCVKEIPTLKDLREKYKDDFEIISVLFDEYITVKEIQEFMKKHDIGYPVTVGEENFKLFKHLGDVQKVPEMFLYARNGAYQKKFTGETSKEALESALIDALNVK